MKKLILFCAVLLGLGGCTKSYLDKKPNKALLVPTTLDDFQALLDNVNTGSLNMMAGGLGEIASDNFFSDDLAALGATEGNAYYWKNSFEGASADDWNRPYQAVFYSNVVLDGLKGLPATPASQAVYDRVKGSALYYRGLAFYGLAQAFARPYDRTAATGDPGIPLHLTSDVNVLAGRGTLQQTYDQALADLQAASILVPAASNYKNRPTKGAAQAALSRVYLAMENYPAALSAATAALAQSAILLDYNTLKPTGRNDPFPLLLPNGNPEVYCYSYLAGYNFFADPATLADPALYQSYAANDLRKSCFFADLGGGPLNFAGSYTGYYYTMFAGMATDEVYLNRAECYARAGNTAAALTDLNTLLKARWKAGTFVPFGAATAGDALALILAERRKELIGRGLRWADLRRLNKDPRFAITLTRATPGQSYQLPPNDPRYTFPIPDDEAARSGIAQN